MQPMGIAMGIAPAAGGISEEAAKVIAHAKCCAIPLLIFSILAVPDLFIIIPGCICAGQFLCCWPTGMPVTKVLDTIRCAKCAATTTIVLACISAAGSLGWGSYTFTTACYYYTVWWTTYASAGCFDDIYGYMLMSKVAVVDIPCIICASLICCACGKLEPMLASPQASV